MSDELRNQVDEIIRDEIQETINEYIDSNNGKGFVDSEKLKVNIPKNEVDKLIKEYKKIKKYRKSNLFQASKLLDKNGNPL